MLCRACNRGRCVPTVVQLAFRQVDLLEDRRRFDITELLHPVPQALRRSGALGLANHLAAAALCRVSQGSPHAGSSYMEALVVTSMTRCYRSCQLRL